MKKAIFAMALLALFSVILFPVYASTEVLNGKILTEEIWYYDNGQQFTKEEISEFSDVLLAEVELRQVVCCAPGAYTIGYNDNHTYQMPLPASCTIRRLAMKRCTLCGTIYSVTESKFEHVHTY